MKLLEKETLSGILRWALEGVFVIGVLCILFLRYYLLRYYFWLFRGDTDYFRFTLRILYLSGAAGLVIIRQLIIIFKTITLKNPFIDKNVKSLKIISFCCFMISAVFIVKWIFYPSLISLAAIFMFIIAGLCAFVMSQLFKQAVLFKSENDLTI